VTKTVTALDCMVFSPVDYPATPTELPNVFDDFKRCVQQLAERAFTGWKDPDSGEFTFVPRPGVLRDGWSTPESLPPGWRGRITLRQVADYFNASFELTARDEHAPGWGVHSVDDRIVGDHLLELAFKPNMPLVDPVRDVARIDTPDLGALDVSVAGDFRTVLGGWENLDAYMSMGDAGDLWLSARKMQFYASSSRWFSEVRGLRDSADWRRYRGQWHQPKREPAMAYLGWPAYFVDAGGQLGRCTCGARTPQGAVYCGSPGCNRARQQERQRESRAARKQLAKGLGRP